MKQKPVMAHELTHALLHSVLKDVPLWLDEGLAGYFELPPENGGVNAQHLEQLARGPFKPDLARLERLTDVAEMQKPEYREAWAWVHLMLRGRPEAKPVLLAYLQQLRANPSPGALRPRLAQALAAPEEALVRHVGQVDAPAVIVPTSSVECRLVSSDISPALTYWASGWDSTLATSCATTDEGSFDISCNLASASALTARSAADLASRP